MQSAPFPKHPEYDAVVVGGGMYGATVATKLRAQFARVLVVEQEADLLQRASFGNQARVHNGYHYPRSLTTGLRSRVNFDRFCNEFPEAVVSAFDKYYAIAAGGFSNVTAAQFEGFCDRIGAHRSPAPPWIRDALDPSLIESVYTVREYAFDSSKLKEIVRRRMAEAEVEVLLKTRVETVSERRSARHPLAVDLGEAGVVTASHVFLCTYGSMNHVLSRSGLPLIPLRQELAELALVRPPPQLERCGLTVMCGPFFSIMPFPALGLHSFSHVRYTPRRSWSEGFGEPLGEAALRITEAPRMSAYVAMLKDSARYMPILEQCRYERSLFEVKTILPRNDENDGRPILFRRDWALKGLTCVLGGKIDNIYDVYEALEDLKEDRATP